MKTFIRKKALKAEVDQLRQEMWKRNPQPRKERREHFVSATGVKRVKAVVNVTIVLSVVAVNISLEAVGRRVQRNRETPRDCSEGARRGPV